jgi:hypothetical protein
MPTALLLLASLVPGDGPPPTSQDLHEAALAELVRGSWFGNWSREGDRDGGVFLRQGILTLPRNPPAKLRLTIDKEGRGWFRGRIGDVAIVGIWKYRGGCLVLCYTEADKGFPKNFEDGEQRDVLTLWPK